MRLVNDDYGTHVFLSRRNLLSLLAKLDGSPLDSHMTIAGPTQYGSFAVTAEEDEKHYAHESREGVPAGRMHPDTEAATDGAGLSGQT